MQTLVLIKPDATTKRKLIGQIVNRIEEAGFTITVMGIVDADKSVVEEHYQEHADRDYFTYLVSSMIGRVVVLVVEHSEFPEDSIGVMRGLLGSYTDPRRGTLRWEFALNRTENSVHSSDSPESAEREIILWSELI